MSRAEFSERLDKEMRFCDNKVAKLKRQLKETTSNISYWENQANYARLMNARFSFGNNESSFDE